MFQVNARLLYNKRIKKNCHEMALSAPQIAKSALPGQFINIKVTDGLEPLLRRPFSIHQIYRQDGIKILYEAIGKGSKALARRKSGESLDVIGPLGNGFKLGRGPGAGGRRHVLVAGGMGTAPLVFLAERLAEAKNQKPKTKTLVLLGARTKDDILCEKEFKELGCEVRIATDDGSRGFKGYVSELLKDELNAIRYPLSAIYACGPTPMLKEISRISQEYDIPAQISLEAHMACGIGACMGCVIKTARNALRATEYEYKRVCKEGPVFEASRVIWD
ncbi:dihydroorotate dehydrogenase electron transfer subunit [bacterium]|nr:MAG: dihydroorotate dehydrogenase electron transfer subunit [bacterium]